MHLVSLIQQHQQSLQADKQRTETEQTTPVHPTPLPTADAWKGQANTLLLKPQGAQEPQEAQENSMPYQARISGGGNSCQGCVAGAELNHCPFLPSPQRAPPSLGGVVHTRTASPRTQEESVDHASRHRLADPWDCGSHRAAPSLRTAPPQLEVTLKRAASSSAVTNPTGFVSLSREASTPKRLLFSF